MNEELRALLNSLSSIMQFAQRNMGSLSTQTKQMLSQLVEASNSLLERQQQAQAASRPSNDAQLLWYLAGQNPQPFLDYLSQFPSNETRSLLNNPAQLQETIQQLQQMDPFQANKGAVEGIPKAGLNSSNVYGFRYDPKSGKLKVRFNEGQIYEYDDVPLNVFLAFKNGAASAKTDGRNMYGEWFRGKNPSLGASVWEYLRNGGYNYRRVA